VRAAPDVQENQRWRLAGLRPYRQPSANLPELLLAGRDDIVHSAEQSGGTRAIAEMYRARQTDAEQNRPHYADPIGCPVLAVGAQAYLDFFAGD
jgi:hypothetical protein